MKKNRLTDLFFAYQRNETDYRHLFTETAIFCYHYQMKNNQLNEDENSNFFVRFYTLLPRVIKNFHYIGATFESYLIAVIRNELRRYFSRQWRGQRLAQKIIDFYPEITHVYEYYQYYDESVDQVAEREPLYQTGNRLFFSENNGKKLKKYKSRRHFIIILLKNAHFLTMPIIEQCAEFCSYPTEKLFAMVEQVKRLNAKQLKRHKYVESWQRQKILKVLLQHHKLEMSNSKEETIQLKEQLTQEHKKLDIITEKLQKVRIMPTNKSIARVLRIPTGTVDSCMARFKKIAATREYGG